MSLFSYNKIVINTNKLNTKLVFTLTDFCEISQIPIMPIKNPPIGLPIRPAPIPPIPQQNPTAALKMATQHDLVKTRPNNSLSKKDSESRRRLTLLLDQKKYTELEDGAKAKNISIQQYVREILNGPLPAGFDSATLDLLPLDELRTMLHNLTSQTNTNKDWSRQSAQILSAIKRRYRR